MTGVMVGIPATMAAGDGCQVRRMRIAIPEGETTVVRGTTLPETGKMSASATDNGMEIPGGETTIELRDRLIRGGLHPLDAALGHDPVLDDPDPGLGLGLQRRKQSRILEHPVCSQRKRRRCSMRTGRAQS
jgi:hypothetical protein